LAFQHKTLTRVDGKPFVASIQIPVYKHKPNVRRQVWPSRTDHHSHSVWDTLFYLNVQPALAHFLLLMMLQSLRPLQFMRIWV